MGGIDGAAAGRAPGEEGTVVVVGAGPVGLVAAIELARAGLRPVVLDAKEGVAWSSRAICLSRRSLEILDRIGAGPAFAAKALPWSRGRTFHRDRLVFRLEMPHAPGDRHAPFANLQQFHTERFLLDALGEHGVEPRWGSRVTGLAEDAGGVTLEVAGPDGNGALRAGWVVAADGGRSAVRELKGLSLRGTSYEGRYLIADIEVPGAEWPVERHVWFDPPSNPGSTVILHVQPDDVWRIDYQLRDDEDAEEALREENVLSRLGAQLGMMGVRQPWRLVWRSLYRAHCLSLDSYRHGRVLFAGDAAHLVPIFGVRGLNSGIDDAHNLGWKLAMVARGRAPEALLDSYSHERLRATRENIAAASKSTWFMSPPSGGIRLMRDAVLTLAADHPWASLLVDPRQSSAHVYDDSPAVLPDAAPGAPGVPPGSPLPNPPVALADGATGRGLHDALPPRGFALLVFPAVLGAARAAALAALPLGVVPIGSAESTAAVPGAARGVADPDGALARLFAAAEFPIYLVRPDEHVAARLGPAAGVAEVAAALERALGRDGAPPRLVAAAAPAADARAGTLGREGLERAFEAVSAGLDAAGEEADRRFLARLALLLVEEVGDPARVLALVAAASEGAAPA